MSTPRTPTASGGAPPAEGERSTKDLARAAVSGWLGTALEFMDYQLYSLATALVFAFLFFPSDEPGVALIAAMGVYGVGYVARLAGAVYFGRMGDRLGRKRVLVITIALMGGSTTLIGVLPTYEQVGLLAPALLVALRLVQGFGAGAEIAGATVMLVEYAPVRRRGLIASLVALGTNTGTLLASGIWAILLQVLTQDQLLSWGWRLPFLLSIVLLLMTVYIRRHLKESPVFEQRADVQDGVALTRAEIAAQESAADRGVIESGLEQRKGRAFFLAFGLRFGQAGNSGIIQTFLLGYLATELLLEGTVGTTAILIGSAIGFLTVPLAGMAGDRFGRRPVYTVLTIFTMAYAFPMVAMLDTRDPLLVSIAIVVALNLGVLGLFSMESVTMAELFGGRSRFTQLALAKEIGGVLATAIGPVLAAALTVATGSGWPIAVMIVAYSACALVAARLAPETRGRDLVQLQDAA
ncbi:MFS transporter [uncultured Pseudokineococcus sp.]|uniref:MFS transporter n=1 Tax=uncultured Pseudokineococcus sp. TaxID=1642928 RepID=UPI00261EDA18|nr:MFS transporter [uncultured Pseudokineococcus sp.]